MKLAPPVVALPYLERHDAAGSKFAIIRLHGWLDSSSISLQALTVTDLNRFFADLEMQKAKSRASYFRRVLRGYFYWLYDVSLISFHPCSAGFSTHCSQPRTATLPTSARAFLTHQGRNDGAPYLLRFHAWIDAKHITVSGVTGTEVQRFFEQPFRKVLIPKNAYYYRRALCAYLFWLYDRGHLQFDPAAIGLARSGPRRSDLPQSAVEFIQTLKPTIKASSCSNYRGALDQFHQWLDSAKLPLKRLNRQQCEQWLISLNDRKLAPQTRIQLIIKVRSYLRWLAERGDLKVDPDALLRPSDFPKLPIYLPRPLSPEIDRELQRRFLASNDPLHRGLCLMRLTGMRVGELLSLEADCLRVDLFGNRFLKVPLGKLDKERLVPLSQAAYELLDWLQHIAPYPRLRLLQTNEGLRVPFDRVAKALASATVGMVDSKPITTHRLRHTYATELIGAGMSLVGVMKLLGHHSFRMTLRYTAITQEHTGREYFAAMQRIEQRYLSTPAQTSNVDVFDPIKASTDMIAWLQNNVSPISNKHAKSVSILSKRLIRVQNQIQAFMVEKQSVKVAG
jgi:site-specific recombinase XerD